LTALLFPTSLGTGSPAMPCRTALGRLVLTATLTAVGPACLCAQLKVTKLAATADGPAFYGETVGSNLTGMKRLTTPLLNITFVTESGFRSAQRDAADHALPASLRLAGLHPADFQEIADAVHDAFMAELKAQGISVLPYEPLAVNPSFQSLARAAAPSGKERPAPESYQTIAGVSGARRTMTFVGHRCPWVESFMSANYLPATRLTRELEAALPIISFLVDFVEYSTDRTTTYDWREWLPAGAPSSDVPRLRARPQVYLAAASAAFLLPDGQTATLTLTAPVGLERAFATALVRTRGRNREERQGGSYEVTVDPTAYKEAVAGLLKVQVAAIVRRLTASGG
jgi:hypothetical protein